MRIAMWSGPRNISTALMRSFENRTDTHVTDEPFYAYFLKESGENHPAREEILNDQSSSWETVSNTLTGAIPNQKQIWYQTTIMSHKIIFCLKRDGNIRQYGNTNHIVPRRGVPSLPSCGRMLPIKRNMNLVASKNCVDTKGKTSILEKKQR